MYKTILISALFIVLSCSPNDQLLEVAGTLERQGITSYQYGTHILVTTETQYALRSEEIALDSFNNMEVRLQGRKVEGYPLEGGPPLLEVQDIEKE